MTKDRVYYKMGELSLYVKEGDLYKHLVVPVYVVRDLLRDRLSQNEWDRISRLAKERKPPKKFVKGKKGTVIINPSEKTATCFQTGINMEYLEPTWNVTIEELKLDNYF